MREAGMAVCLDPAGTLVGRREGRSQQTLLVGSHIDTVRNAGRFDGILGVLVGIEAIEALNARQVQLPFSVEVVAFGDEEGVRFPVTLTGSHALAGTLEAATLDVVDADGVSLREALIAFGCNPAAIPTTARDPGHILGYIEVHIEQGPILDSEQLAVGVVTAIDGASRFNIEIHGAAGHAGTVPMRLRHDTVAAAAEMILLVEQTACLRDDIVATVGQIRPCPGAPNVIAAKTRLTLDIRSPHDSSRREAIATLHREFESIAKRRGVKMTVTETYNQAAVKCDNRLIAQLEKAVAAENIRSRRLSSGAGHDGLAMASLCPIGMLFVRCERGISHHPSESILPDDAEIATHVLVDFLLHLNPERT
jgi:allantoate deiminase